MASPPSDGSPEPSWGRGYQVSGTHSQPPTKFGEETQLEFLATEVVYEPLWATREAAAAFGITLIEPGQGLRMQSPIRHLENTPFEYGMLASNAPIWTRSTATSCSPRCAPIWSTMIFRMCSPR